VTLSDSGGFIHDPDGLDQEKIDWVKAHKAKRGARIRDYVDQFGGEFHENKRPWGVPCDVALPCATQNELNEEEARALVENGCQAVSEGANMPTTQEGVHVFLNAKVLFGPGKAANAGGVAMSGLEMSQNAARLHRSAEDLRRALKQIMVDIHNSCRAYGEEEDGYVNYVKGANIAGFKKVADAILAFGVV
jgi:glutamate dehydrogenase (NADP+)